MSANVNIVLLAGNLTRDPELRYLPSGQPVCSFSIAINRIFTNDKNEKQEQVSFIRIVAWARLAEICNEYLKKGSSVMVDGRMESRSWEAQDGTKRSTVEVVAAHVQFLSPKAGAATQSAPRQTATAGTLSADELRPDEEFPENLK
jgi:single-strand DNA-binding protein